MGVFQTFKRGLEEGRRRGAGLPPTPTPMEWDIAERMMERLAQSGRFTYILLVREGHSFLRGHYDTARPLATETAGPYMLSLQSPTPHLAELSASQIAATLA